MTEKKYKADIVKKMKAVNTYNKSFDHAIKVLAKTLADYDIVLEKFESTGGSIVIKHTNKNQKYRKPSVPRPRETKGRYLGILKGVRVDPCWAE